MKNAQSYNKKLKRADYIRTNNNRNKKKTRSIGNKILSYLAYGTLIWSAMALIMLKLTEIQDTRYTMILYPVFILPFINGKLKDY